MTSGQRDVVIAVATSPDRLVTVEATAGTGKTTAAGVIRAAIEAEGTAVRGAAPTGKAGPVPIFRRKDRSAMPPP